VCPIYYYIYIYIIIIIITISNIHQIISIFNFDMLKRDKRLLSKKLIVLFSIR